MVLQSNTTGDAVPLGGKTRGHGASARDDRIDFLRGLALLIIFIDHVRKHPFKLYTLHSYAFCDAAEIFFFISGLVAALVYGRLLREQGLLPATRRIWKRAGAVYGAQLLLVAVIVSLAWISFAATGDEHLRQQFRLNGLFETPLSYVVPALTLHYQPGLADILPCYVVLLLVFPLVLTGLERNVWLVLAPSFALWLAVQIFGLNLRTTTGVPWFFNPFAWQLLFVLGALFGHPANKGRFAFLDSPILFWSALAVTAAIFVVQVSAKLHILPADLPWHPDVLPLDKTSLAPLRLVSFFAPAVVIRRWLPRKGLLSDHPVTLAIVRCGRSSLKIFTFGSLLASVSVVTFLSGAGRWVQSAICIAGLAAQLALAAWLDARRQGRASVQLSYSAAGRLRRPSWPAGRASRSSTATVILKSRVDG